MGAPALGLVHVSQGVYKISSLGRPAAADLTPGLQQKRHYYAVLACSACGVNMLLPPHFPAPQIYLRYLSAWRDRTGQLLTHYVHCDRWSVWGRWGAQEYPSQPRAQARWLCCCFRLLAATAF